MAVLSLTEVELRARSSQKWCHYGPEVLPMWVAEMDVAVHPAVREAILAALDLGDTGYPIGTAYAEAFAAMASRRWGLDLAIGSQVRQSGDVMNSLLTVLLAVTEPGDEVIINTPVYPPFRLVTEGHRRRPVEVPLRPDGRLDLPAVRAAIERRPAAYLLCSPHNPHGTVHTAEELTAVATACAENGVRLVVDEIHACLVDPGVSFVPALSVPGGEQAIAVTSAGKAWNLAGFKAGLIMAGTGAAPLLRTLSPVQLSAMGHLAAIAHTAAMVHAQDWIDELMIEIQQNKLLLKDLLAQQLPAVRYQPAAGTYLAWVNCEGLGLSNPPASFLERGKVAFSPGRMFGADHEQWVRINLAASPAIVTEGVRRMQASLSS